MRSAEGLACGAGQHDRAFVQRILELSACDQAGLVRAVEDEFPAPLGDDPAHLAHGQREERHGHAHHHQHRFVLAGGFGKAIQVHFEFVHVEGHIENLQAARPGRAVGAVAGVPAEGLRRRHDHVTGLGQRVIDRHVAEHAAHQAMVGVIAAEGGFEQLDAQGFDLVDVLGAGKPAVDASDVSFGCPRSNFGREQGAHHRAGRRFGRQQIDTAFTAPFFVPFDGIDDGLRPHPGEFSSRS